MFSLYMYDREFITIILSHTLIRFVYKNRLPWDVLSLASQTPFHKEGIKWSGDLPYCHC